MNLNYINYMDKLRDSQSVEYRFSNRQYSNWRVNLRCFRNVAFRLQLGILLKSARRDADPLGSTKMVQQLIGNTYLRGFKIG